MKKKPSVFDIEQCLKQDISAPPDSQKAAILARAASTAQDSPDSAFPAVPPRKKRAGWQLAATLTVLAVVLVGSAAWFGRGGGVGMNAAEDAETPLATYGGVDLTYEADRTYDDENTLTFAATGAAGEADVFADGEHYFAADIIAGAPSESMASPEAPPAEKPDVEDGAGDWERVPAVQPAAGLLTAGEWCDNDDFAFFAELLTDARWFNYVELYGLTFAERYVVTVADAQGAPVPAAEVALTDAQGNTLFAAVTDHSGTAYLFAASDEIASRAAAITAASDGVTETAPITDTAQGPGASFVLGGSAPQILDLMFVIDTTGSMCDELMYLQAELRDVIATVADEHPNMTIRLSVNFYRDEGDDYVVLPTEFTGDIDAALATLAAQFANGGGDEPEAVHTALEDALAHDWSEHSVKLLYFVLDAPPHSETPSVIASLQQTLPRFAAEGIRIIPVAASGAGTEAEYFLRYCATLTGGTYTFLTDHSGIGNSHAEPTVGQYEVRPLNELLIEITSRYCG